MMLMDVLNPEVDQLEYLFAPNLKNEEPILPLVEFDDTSSVYPKVDILESDREFILRAEVPGYRKEEMDIVFDGGILIITARRIPEKSEEKILYKERFTGNFVRKFQLSRNIQKDAIRASYRDGILEIHLPKQSAVEKEIKIK